LNMKSKLISIPYTVGLIKPHIALREDKVSSSFFHSPLCSCAVG
jgi:hypothetical protein